MHRNGARILALSQQEAIHQRLGPMRFHPAVAARAQEHPVGWCIGQRISASAGAARPPVVNFRAGPAAAFAKTGRSFVNQLPRLRRETAQSRWPLLGTSEVATTLIGSSGRASNSSRSGRCSLSRYSLGDVITGRRRIRHPKPPRLDRPRHSECSHRSPGHRR